MKPSRRKPVMADAGVQACKDPTTALGLQSRSTALGVHIREVIAIPLLIAVARGLSRALSCDRRRLHRPRIRARLTVW